MDVGKILHELTYAEGLPKQALKARRHLPNGPRWFLCSSRRSKISLPSTLVHRPNRRRSSSFSTSSASGGRSPLIGPWLVCSDFPVVKLMRSLGMGSPPPVTASMAAVFDGDPQPLSGTYTFELRVEVERA